MLKNCSNFMDYSSYKKGRTDFSVAEVKGVVQSRGIGTKKEKMIKGWLVGYHLPLATARYTAENQKTCRKEDIFIGHNFGHYSKLMTHSHSPSFTVHRIFLNLMTRKGKK